MRNFKDTGTKACLGERILGGAYFNEGVCDVNHNSHHFSTLLVYTLSHEFQLIFFKFIRHNKILHNKGKYGNVCLCSQETKKNTDIYC